MPWPERAVTKFPLRRMLLASLLPALLSAQQPPTERPRIGLALAGGSSLGLAHIGVLQWLFEHRIPIDSVAGASMGGLVGGLFCSGADPEEMKEFVRAIDWDAALSGAPPFRQLSFRRKEDRREFPNILEFGLKKGLSLPSALSPGHGVGLVLSRIAAPYPDLSSFDELPTAFRTLAVDLVDSKRVVFDRGDLFEALRATMSIPGVFAPVHRGSQVLVDGGVLDNLPVDIVRDAKADIVIAVALHGQLARKPGAYSLIDVASRSIDVTIAANELRSIAAADIVLIPDIDGFASTDFRRGDELIARGYQSAEKKSRMLLTYALPPSEWEQWLTRRHARRRPSEFTASFVTAKDLSPRLQANFERRLKPILGPPIDRSRLDDELTRLTGLGRYDAVDYSLTQRDGQTGVLVHAREKLYGPPFLNTGIEIEGGTSQDLRLGVAGRLTFLDVGASGSEWRSDFGLGRRDFLSTEYFYRLRSSKFFVAPQAFLVESKLDVFEGQGRIARVNTRDGGGGLDIGYAAGRFSEFRLGYVYSHLRFSTTIGLPNLPAFGGGVSRIRARYVYEGQDSALVANRGLRFEFNGQWILTAPAAGKQFLVADTQLRWARALSPRYVLSAAAAGGISGSGNALYTPFFLGGPLQLAALAPDQLIGRHFYYGQTALLRRLSAKPGSFLYRFYTAAAVEAGNAFFSTSDANPFFDGVAGVIGETPLGVVFVGGSIGESGNRKVFFHLGRFF